MFDESIYPCSRQIKTNSNSILGSPSNIQHVLLPTPDFLTKSRVPATSTLSSGNPLPFSNSNSFRTNPASSALPNQHPNQIQMLMSQSPSQHTDYSSPTQTLPHPTEISPSFLSHNLPSSTSSQTSLINPNSPECTYPMELRPTTMTKCFGANTVALYLSKSLSTVVEPTCFSKAIK